MRRDVVFRIGRRTLIGMLLASVAISALSGCARNGERVPTLKEAKAAYERGEFEKAAGQLTTIVAREPENTEAHRTFALTLAAKGDNAGAIKEYAAVIERDAKDHASLYRMALLERLTGDAADATKHLEAATGIKATPSYLDELARTYMQVGRYADAASAWGKALESKDMTDENRVALLRVQAEAYASAGEYDAAKGALNAALKLDPDNAEMKQRLKSFK